MRIRCAFERRVLVARVFGCICSEQAEVIIACGFGKQLITEKKTYNNKLITLRAFYLKCKPPCIFRYFYEITSGFDSVQYR